MRASLIHAGARYVTLVVAVLMEAVRLVRDARITYV